MGVQRRVRVLVVDDSALVRQILAQGLAADPGIEVAGTAGDPYEARDRIVELRPDVMTLDVEMPRMDGVEFLRKLMPQHPLPVVMVSSLTNQGARVTLDAMEAGAVDYVAKPVAGVADGLAAMMVELCAKVKVAATANVSAWKHRRDLLEKVFTAPARHLAATTDKVVVIGASTGGTEALREVLSGLPADAPGLVIVQHMPAGFTRIFAERLNSLAAIEVKEAVQGDRILAGRALLAPGGRHLRVVKSGGHYAVDVSPGASVNGHCPSVEVLMDSAASAIGANAVGVMLTGMGADGADAMVRLRKAGARCLAQDEATSVVFGMPKEAFARGGAERLVPLPEIAGAVLAMLDGTNPGATTRRNP